MGRVKDWLMDMEEDAHNISNSEFVKKHGSDNEKIWQRTNAAGSKQDFNFYNTEEDFETVDSSNKEISPVDDNTNYDYIPF